VRAIRLTSLDSSAPMQEIIFTSSSGGSRGEHSSSYTACVQDVQNGLLDMCAGSFWITDQRLTLSSFTKTVGPLTLIRTRRIRKVSAIRVLRESRSHDAAEDAPSAVACEPSARKQRMRDSRSGLIAATR
jgi:hypothetical protein